MATNDLPAPPTASDVAATLRAAATAIATAAANIESCTGHPLFADGELSLVHNARRLTRTAQGTVNQAVCELTELQHALEQTSANVA